MTQDERWNTDGLRFMIHGYDDEGENRDAIISQHKGQEERPAENGRGMEGEEK